MGVGSVGGRGNEALSVPYVNGAITEIEAATIAANHPELRQLHENMRGLTDDLYFEDVLPRFVRSNASHSVSANVAGSYASFLLSALYSKRGREFGKMAQNTANTNDRAYWEHAARHARSVAIMLIKRKIEPFGIFTGIDRFLQKPEIRRTGIDVLNLAVQNVTENHPAQAKMIEDFVDALWEGFEKAAWQKALQSALERMRGKYLYESGADLLFTTDVPWDADAPISSPIQWGYSLWRELHKFTKVEHGISTRALFTLLLNGEKNLFGTFRDQSWRYKELGDAGRMQRHALNHLLFVAASQKLTNVRRFIIETTMKIIDSEEFKNETGYRQTLRELVYDVIYLVSQPEVNPRIEQDAASVIASLYGRRAVPGRYYEIGQALFLLRPLMDQSYDENAATAESLQELADSYAKKDLPPKSGTPSPAPAGTPGETAPESPAPAGGSVASGSSVSGLVEDTGETSGGANFEGAAHVHSATRGTAGRTQRRFGHTQLAGTRATIQVRRAGTAIIAAPVRPAQIAVP